MTDAPGPGSARVTAEQARLAAVDAAREAWIARLIDLSRRNNLLYYRDLRTGTLDLDGHRAEHMARLLAGEPVLYDALLPQDEEAARRSQQSLMEIRRRAVANLEEKGLETLFLAMGMATWPAADGGRPLAAPVLLVPIALEQRGREGRSIAIRRHGDDLQINLVLLHALEQLAGVRIEPDALLPTGEETEPAAETVFVRLQAGAAAVRGFAIAPRHVIGNFAFQKMAMVRDLRELGAVLAQHDLIAAIAGDGPARRAIQGDRLPIDPAQFDAEPPLSEFLVLDADSSQHRVVKAVLAGQDGVIQGPPGTGKSQTIVNLIAGLAAAGQNVLFVAEKRAALEVVLRRLEGAGLGHLALDLHGADLSRREVMARIQRSLATLRESLPVPDGDAARLLVERRNRLNAHVQRMHAGRLPSGLSAYELQGRLLRVARVHHATTRWRGAELAAIDAAAAARIRSLLAEAMGFEGLFLRDGSSPWEGALLPDGSAVEAARDLVQRLARETIPAARRAVDGLATELGIASPDRPAAAQPLSTAAVAVSGVLQAYRPELGAAIAGKAPEFVIEDLGPAETNPLSRFLAGLVNGRYRRARRLARSFRLQPADPRTMLIELRAAAGALEQWRAVAGEARPVAAASATDAAQRLATLAAEIMALAAILPGRDPAQAAWDNLAAVAESLASDTVTPARIPALFALEAELATLGAGRLLDELRGRARAEEPLTGDSTAALFDAAYWASCLDRAQGEDAALAGFNGTTHSRIVEEFRRLDRERLKAAAARVRRAHAEGVIEIMNRFPDQEALIRREAEKRARHLPLRRLLALAPDVLTSLTPCWMASPLSVSQLLDGSRQYFDVVIFDEASQVLPEDAVTSLLRGRRTAVAGDSKQLPPTTFFAAGEAEENGEEDPGPTAGFESLLDNLSAFIEPWTLDWHYRSRDEALIAFSNREIYGSRLVTFPGPGGPPVIGHVAVDQGEWREGEEESASAEVRRVVDLALEHAEQRPNQTLGIIAMGIPHARRVEAAIDDALRARPDLDTFFDQSKDERFFVKNLERVQGDERDAIILTVGYGKDARGRLPYRFGPLLMAGGERRLNVAITRARRRMTLVSSFSHLDMDPGRSTARGVELLRRYLEFTASGGTRIAPGAGAPPAGPFEADVYDALAANGVTAAAQLGASRYRLDLAVRDPADPERFLLAIECDGPAYRSAPTARDRDRLRQQQLEALGWRFHRIWSTDWYLRRDQEIARALEAVRVAAAPPAAAATAPVPRPPATPASQAAGEPRRLPRPRIGRRESIDDYTGRELSGLIAWLMSDGRLRTDDELIDEAMAELGFSRRGPRIEAALRVAVEAARSP